MAALLIESLIRNNSKLQIAIWGVELGFLFSCVFSTIFMVKDAVFPCSVSMIFSSFKNIIISFTSPLYIVLVINFMVVLIAVLSTNHHQNHVEKHTHEALYEDHDDGLVQKASPSPPSPPPPPPQAQPHEDQESAIIMIDTEEKEVIEDTSDKLENDSSDWENIPATLKSWNKTLWRCDIQTNHETLALIDASYLTEEPNDQVNKEMDSLGEQELQLTNEENDDTMEAMWKVISEGTEKPLKKQLKKSETCPIKAKPNFTSMQSIDSKGLLPSAAATWKELRKSVTFDDTISMRKRGGLMRDNSMSLDNLNKQVETFINKFNNAMRIERQESEQRFFDKVKRGI